ncbi:MAG: hypothetical protein JRI95_17210 [Deltaproteobacteria bacterium]|nr:hypothetical protein [Deltaproteobacteria bacterium]
MAGIAIGTKQHIRPVLGTENLTISLLARNAGPFDMGNMVQLGTIIHKPDPPHTEDYLFEPSECLLKGVARETFWEVLERISKNRLKEIFGDDLRHIGQSLYGTDPGCGQASLGCLRLNRKPSLYVDTGRSGKPQVRLNFTDGELHVNAGITDIRFYEIDDYSPKEKIINDTKTQIKASSAIIISLGLSRPFASSSQFDPVNWLQVNNIHFRENPVWQLD